MHRTRRSLISAASILAVAGLASADDHNNLHFAELAPAGIGLFSATPNFSAMNQAFLNTPLEAWWTSEEVQDWFEETITGALDEANDDFESLELDTDDFVMPTGTAGLALWAVAPEGEDAGALHFMVGADFGDEGIETMVETFEGILDEARDGGAIEVTETDFGNTIIYTIVGVEDEEDNDFDDDFMAEFEGFEEPEDPFETIHIVRAGTFMIASTSMEDLENAIDRIDGNDFDSLADQEAFGKAAAEFEDAHGHAILVNGPWYEVQKAVDAMNEDDPFAGPPVMQLLDAFGISAVQGGTIALYIDTDKGIMETPFVVNATGFDGLLSIFNTNARPLTPPAFVGGDSVGVSLIQAKLSEALPALRASVNKLDPETAAQFNQQLAMVSGLAGPILQNVGPEIFIIQSLTRPFTAESQQATFAIRTTDSKALTEAIAGPAQGFLGMQPREFQGAQVFSADGGFVEIAIGITNDFLFVGTEAGVEDAIRQAANPGGATLANEDRFKNAMSDLDAEGLSFSWTDTKATFEYLKWTSENFDQIIRAQVESWAGPAGYTDAEIDELVEQQGGEPPFEIPNIDLLIEALGDSVSQVQTTPTGFRGNSILLRAE